MTLDVSFKLTWKAFCDLPISCAFDPSEKSATPTGNPWLPLQRQPICTVICLQTGTNRLLDYVCLAHIGGSCEKCGAAWYALPNSSSKSLKAHWTRHHLKVHRFSGQQCHYYVRPETHYWYPLLTGGNLRALMWRCIDQLKAALQWGRSFGNTYGQT